MGLGGGVPQHFWSPKEGGKVPVPWGLGAHVGVDICGRLQPLSMKVDCYSKHCRPHPVPTQAEVSQSCEDLCDRLEFDTLKCKVFLLADGRTNPLKHKLDSTTALVKKAEAKLLLERAAQARADQPEYQTFTSSDWSDLRDKIKAAQKITAHYNAMFYAMVQEWINSTGRSGRFFLRVSAYESDPQLADLLKQELIDYLVSDDSDVMCFGAKNQYSGYMNVNKNIPRRHSILRLELQLALDFLAPWWSEPAAPSSSSSSSSSLSSSSSSAAAAAPSSFARYIVDLLLPVLATVLGNDNFPWSLATTCVHAWLCTRGCASCL